jgi:membrane fusion protein, multidrug efflux system
MLGDQALPPRHTKRSGRGLVSLLERANREKELAFAVFLLAIIASWSAGCGNVALPPAGPPTVEVVEAVQQDVPITKDWVATLDGYVNAQVRAQVTGLLLKQNYINGSYVKRDAALFEIDPRPFQAALDQAKGNQAQAEADLQRAQAQLGKTELDVARYTPLAKQSAISQQELDDAVQANLAAKAQVEQARAAIESSRAAVDAAKLNLGFTKISSPIDGVAAISTAQVGDFVGPQAAPLTTVSTLDPILAIITPSEQEYLAAMNRSANDRVKDDTLLRKLEWLLKLADGTTFPYKGRFYAIDREIDVKTGAIQVKIQFPNPGNILRPGGFGTVSTVTRIQRGALLVPQRAVNELQGGYRVAVVDPENKAGIRSVRMGQKVGNWWIVDEGIKPGERVVAEGVQQVQDGAQVTPKPYQESLPVAAVLNGPKGM